MKIDSIINEYKRITLIISRFNYVSKMILFVMTMTIAITNACLLYIYAILKEKQLFIALFCLFAWIVFMSGSIYLLNTAALVSKKSKIMYHLLNTLFVRKNNALTLNQKEQILFILENIGCKERSPISLINLDGQVFDKILLGRYLIYSVRMIFFCKKFSQTLGNN